jgi:hypothetical protein
VRHTHPGGRRCGKTVVCQDGGQGPHTHSIEYVQPCKHNLLRCYHSAHPCQPPNSGSHGCILVLWGPAEAKRTDLRLERRAGPHQVIP